MNEPPLFLIRHQIARRYRVPASQLTATTASELEEQARRIHHEHEPDTEDTP